MDKSWIHESRLSPAYEVGVARFLDFAYANTSSRQIRCPCINCYNMCYKTRDVVYDHLICNGIGEYYSSKDWSLHGERTLPRSLNETFYGSQARISEASRRVGTQSAQRMDLDQRLNTAKQWLGEVKQQLSEMEERSPGSQVSVPEAPGMAEVEGAQGMAFDQWLSEMKQRLSVMEQNLNVVEQKFQTIAR